MLDGCLLLVKIYPV